MRGKSSLVKTVLLAQLVLLLSVGAASAHYLMPDSVNNESGEIRWQDYARYDDARKFGISQWHRLGRVPILRDSANTPTDLVFRDYGNCGSGVVSYWQPRDGADVVNFNRCGMQGLSTSDRRAVATHELGHALRLGHPSRSKDSAHWRRRSIMYYCPACTSFSAPKPHDKSDYHAIW